MISFIDEHRTEYGVEPICQQLPIAPSTYYEQKAREDDPERLPDRTRRDSALEIVIQRVWEENFEVYGARKVWRQLNRECIEVARCTVERLMKRLGIQGVTRGAKCWTTVSDDTLSPACGPGEPGVYGDAAESAMGCRYHIRCAQPPKAIMEDAVGARACLECIQKNNGGNGLDASSLLWESMSRSGGDLLHISRVTKPAENGVRALSFFCLASMPP